MKKDDFIVIFANLKPRKLGGHISEGMVMCAGSDDHNSLELMRPPPNSKLGERINLEGNPLGDIFTQDFKPILKPKKKVMEAFLTYTKTNSDCEGTFDGIKMVTSGGPIKCESLKNVKVS